MTAKCRHGANAYSLSDLGHVTIRQQLEVSFETGVMDGLPVPFFIERLAKSDVLAHRRVLNPGALRAVCDRPVEPNGTCGATHLADHAFQQRRLPGTNGTYNRHQLALRNCKIHVLQPERRLLRLWFDRCYGTRFLLSLLRLLALLDLLGRRPVPDKLCIDDLNSMLHLDVLNLGFCERLRFEDTIQPLSGVVGIRRTA